MGLSIWRWKGGGVGLNDHDGTLPDLKGVGMESTRLIATLHSCRLERLVEPDYQNVGSTRDSLGQEALPLAPPVTGPPRPMSRYGSGSDDH